MLDRDKLNTILGNVEYQDWAFRVLPANEGWNVQVAFFAEDNNAPMGMGKLVAQYGRKWYVSRFATESEVVQTALKAILTALEHEAREQFKYKGRALFGPHLDVNALMEIADKTQMREARVAA